MQTMIYETIGQMSRMLKNLSGILEKATTHAQPFKSVQSDTILQLRLVMDQFPFARQVQTTCDTAKLLASRLSGKEAPSYPDTETTLGELQTRIKNTVAYLETFQEKDFQGWESRKAQFPWMPGKYLEAKSYFEQFAVPNFYFHMTTAYSILRANGVPLGKADYLGNLPFKDA